MCKIAPPQWLYVHSEGEEMLCMYFPSCYAPSWCAFGQAGELMKLQIYCNALLLRLSET
jgi:hypothetical protein